MQVKRLTLAAGIETAFEFDRFYDRFVMVKNMTSDKILFCDGAFDADKAAVIPSYSWQTFAVTMPYDTTPKFYVKASSAGDVEICFGSDGIGVLGSAFEAAGMIPHTLTLTEGENTTITVSLTRVHGQTLDLETPVSMQGGATVFSGDVVSITTDAEAGKYAKLKINGADYGRLETAMLLVISGETVIKTEAVALVAKTLTLTAGANTTLTSAKVRLAGMLTDLSEAEAVTDGGAVHVGDVIEFTAATTQGDGYHVTLTVNDKPVELDKDGKARIVVEDDTVAVTESVTDEGGE